MSRAFTAARAIAARVGSRLVTSPTSHEPPLVLVFSKDRAIQLELFLRSYAQQLSTPLPLTVMYRATSEAHRQAYEEVFAGYSASELTVIAESAFKPDLLAVLRASNARHVIFFVDDIVFIHPVDTRLLEQWDARDGVLSLRLGRNITHSFNRGNIEQPQPPQLESATLGEQPLARWRWSTGVLDWSLPTSLDGHLLPLPDLVPVIEQASFKAPNSLEGAIGQYKFLFKWRWGYCWEQARIMNLPLNTVKTEDYDFPHQGWDAEQLLEAYQRGLRLDVSELPLSEHNSCHMAWTPTLRPAPEASLGTGT
ncbi:hypothetical protein [Variovorax sp. OV329]|uniref:hypothetical protein n=1 Tax=Variovorax sp. OV329 TaxID=1882825 RepID=UPI0008F219FC|nr:hypothetical protein [Variovorax sp. OV329]SFM98322.1 hypothetical protein SAMN05444747_11299 [Variovorax sp. OV329]